MHVTGHVVHVVPSARHHHKTVITAARRHDEVARQRAEARIDAEVAQTFPASDPPSWNMGVSHPEDWR